MSMPTALLRETAASEAGFCRYCVKKLLEMRISPSNLPNAKELAL
jgi:hypothetical protein